mmetsp:Transcript_7744/g.28442  ORF Transcript_7744/g.28442 Transcript_7744/m.28442 type:complete len:214 (-) Transcript_7744:642-1283(-)
MAPSARASARRSSRSISARPCGFACAASNASNTRFRACTRFTERPSKIRVRFSMRTLILSFSVFRGLRDTTEFARELSNHSVSCTNGTSFSSNNSTVFTIASPSLSAASSSPGADIFTKMTSLRCPLRLVSHTLSASSSLNPFREYDANTYGVFGQNRLNKRCKSPSAPSGTRTYILFFGSSTMSATLRCIPAAAASALVTISTVRSVSAVVG